MCNPSDGAQYTPKHIRKGTTTKPNRRSIERHHESNEHVKHNRQKRPDCHEVPLCRPPVHFLEILHRLPHGKESFLVPPRRAMKLLLGFLALFVRRVHGPSLEDRVGEASVPHYSALADELAERKRVVYALVFRRTAGMRLRWTCPGWSPPTALNFQGVICVLIR